MLNELLKNIKLEEIKSEDSYSELSDGYYLCEVEKVEFTTSKTSGNEMLAWQFKVVEDGIKFNDEWVKEHIPGTTNRKIFMYHSLKDQKAVERMLSDLLKFEKAEDEPILSKEMFVNEEILKEALQLLIGAQLFIHLDTDRDGNQWKRFVNWKNAKKNELVE